MVFAKWLLMRTALSVLVIGFPALITPKAFKNIAEKTLGDAALMVIRGFVAFICGFLYILPGYGFDGTWHMLLPILGGLSLLKGIACIWFPSLIVQRTKALLSKEIVIRGYGILIIVVAVLLFLLAITKF